MLANDAMSHVSVNVRQKGAKKKWRSNADRQRHLFAMHQTLLCGLTGYNSKGIAPCPTMSKCKHRTQQRNSNFQTLHWKEMSGQIRGVPHWCSMFNSTAGFEGNNQPYVFCSQKNVALLSFLQYSITQRYVMSRLNRQSRPRHRHCNDCQPMRFARMGQGTEGMLFRGMLRFILTFRNSPDCHTVFKKLDPTSNSTDAKTYSGEQPVLTH